MSKPVVINVEHALESPGKCIKTQLTGFAPPPPLPRTEFLMQEVLGGAGEYAFLTSSWMMLFLLVREGPWERPQVLSQGKGRGNILGPGMARSLCVAGHRLMRDRVSAGVVGNLCP